MKSEGDGEDRMAIIGHSAPFTGRVKELEEVQSIIEKVLEGRGSTLMISGPAGIGKTCLSKEISRRARLSGFQVVEGSCRRYEGRKSSPFSQLLGATGNPLENTTEEPGWCDVESQRFDVLRKVRSLSLAKPLLVIADDLQWADQGTINVFHYLARNIRMEKVLLVALIRSEEIGYMTDERAEALAEIIKMLRTKGLVHDVRLKPLTSGETIEMIERWLGGSTDGIFSSFLIEGSRGNPLFITEMVKYFQRSSSIRKGLNGWTIDTSKPMHVPEGIAEVVQGHLETLPMQQRDLLESLSVLGHVFPAELAEMMSSMNGPFGRRSLEALVNEHGLIETRDRESSFSHEVVQRAIYEHVPPERRKALHIQAAQAISTSSLKDDHGLLSFHYLEGGDMEKVLEHSLIVARDSVMKESNREGILYYHRVVRSLSALTQYDRYLKFEAYENLGDLYYMICRFDTSQEMFRQALMMAGRDSDKARLIRKMANTVAFHEGVENIGKALEMLDDAEGLAGDSLDEKAEILSFRSTFLHQLGRTEEAISLSKEAAGMFHSLGDNEKELWQRANLAYDLLENDDVFEASNELDRASALLRSDMKKYVQVQYHTISCEVNFQLGAYDRALEDIDVLGHLNPELGHYSDSSYNLWLKAIIYDIMGKEKECVAEASKSLEMANVDEMRRAVLRAKVVLAQALLTTGDLTGCERLMNEVTELFDEPFDTTFIVGPGLYWITLAALHRAKGLNDLADTEAAKGLSIIGSSSKGMAFVPLAHLWVAGSLMRSGSIDDAKVELQRAVDIASKQGNNKLELIVKERYFK